MQSTAGLFLIAIPITAISALTGCARDIPVVRHAPSCAIAAGLATACTAPGRLPADASFTDLVDLLRQDRKSLADCAVRQAALADNSAACARYIDDFNRQIDLLNHRPR
jgi:hypothetical protein